MRDVADKAYAVEQRLNLLWAAQSQVVRTVTGGLLINSAVASSVLTLPNPVNIGIYAVAGQILYNPGATAAGAAIFSWLTGLTASGARIRMREERGYSITPGTTALPVLELGTFSNLTTTFTTATMQANSVCAVEISGAVDVSVAGSLAVQAACTIGTDTFTVLYGSWLALMPQF